MPCGVLKYNGRPNLGTATSYSHLPPSGLSVWLERERTDMLLLRRTATSNATSAMEFDASSSRCPGTERWGAWPSPVGLTLGILAALCAQVAVIAYHYVRLRWCATRRVQTEPRPYPFGDGIKSHLANPGGILMMVAYLCLYWMLDLMPCSYYHLSLIHI